MCLLCLHPDFLLYYFITRLTGYNSLSVATASKKASSASADNGMAPRGGIAHQRTRLRCPAVQGRCARFPRIFRRFEPIWLEPIWLLENKLRTIQHNVLCYIRCGQNVCKTVCKPLQTNSARQEPARLKRKSSSQTRIYMNSWTIFAWFQQFPYQRREIHNVFHATPRHALFPPTHSNECFARICDRTLRLYR